MYREMTTTGGWICPYCMVTVPWTQEHICPLLQNQASSPNEVHQALASLGETHYFKCPHCGEMIEAKITQHISFPQKAETIP